MVMIVIITLNLSITFRQLLDPLPIPISVKQNENSEKYLACLASPAISTLFPSWFLRLRLLVSVA